MKKKFLKNKYVILFFTLTIVGSISCSDKYESFNKISSIPTIITDKDTMTIRVKDYYDYAPGWGFLKITFMDSVTYGMNYTFNSPGNNLIVLYDGIIVNQPVPVNQYTSVYIGCEKTGIYPLEIRATNNYGTYSIKNIVVKVIDGVLPLGNLDITVSQSSPTFTICNFDASLSSSITSKIVLYKFFIDNYLVTSKISKISYNLPSGLHKIGMVAIDDLGKQSILSELSIII